MWFDWKKFFRTYPTVTQFRQWEYEARYTSDVAELESSAFVPLLEYGDAMRGLPMYSLIDTSSFFAGHAFTNSSGFILRSNEKVYPLALPCSRRERRRNGSRAARIRGELHLVEAAGIFALDNYRQNGIKFTRVRIPIDVPHREEIKIIDPQTGHYRQFMTGEQHYKKIRAFIYLALPSYWEDKLDGGFSFPFCKKVTPEGKKSIPFYTFNEAK